MEVPVRLRAEPEWLAEVDRTAETLDATRSWVIRRATRVGLPLLLAADGRASAGSSQTAESKIARPAERDEKSDEATADSPASGSQIPADDETYDSAPDERPAKKAKGSGRFLHDPKEVPDTRRTKMGVTWASFACEAEECTIAHPDRIVKP